MKWYDILVRDEFIDYFSDESNEFYRTCDGEVKYAPQFKRFCDVIYGITVAFNRFRPSIYEHLKQTVPDVYEGCDFCKDKLPEESLADYWRSIDDGDKGKYSVDRSTLSAEQLAVLIMYPFWSRMGGSFEKDFLDSGMLKQYLLALKDRTRPRA